jgi:hypothetical protein
VATAPLARDELERLRSSLVAVGGEPELAMQREVLLLSGFSVPAASDYDALNDPLASSRQHPQVW